MVAFVRTFFAVIFAIGFLVMAPVILGVLLFAFGDTGPQRDSWLTIRLSDSLLEHYPPPTVRTLFEDPPPCLAEVTENLEKASVDDRIVGVLLRFDAFAAGTGKLDEIRAGIRRVRDAGKPVYVYATDLTEGSLYLASECDSTFLFPKGRVFLLGRGATVQHIKGTLDKLDVHDQFTAIGEYKSAVEFFSRTESSPEAAENLRWVVEDLAASFDSTMTENLRLEAGALTRLRERGILTPEEAHEQGLVSEILYFDELEDRMRGAQSEWLTVSSGAYADVERKSVGLGGKPRIAVVHAQGFVMGSGEDRFDAVVGLAMGTDRVVEDLREVTDDDNVRAIILRWDTGGGESVGGDVVARAVARARKEKPVVVSIADVAASAGYAMSYPANTIVCPANGITGSIGMLTGKLNARGLWEKLGVTFDDFSFAPHAFLFSDLHDFTAEQRAVIDRDLWNAYNQWVDDIARARDLTFEEVDAVGRGRVWTGRQALGHGLVDVLGGFDEALAEARRLADLEPDAKVTLEHYPRERSPWEVILSGDFSATAVQGALWDLRTSLFRSARIPRRLGYEPFRSE